MQCPIFSNIILAECVSGFWEELNATGHSCIECWLSCETPCNNRELYGIPLAGQPQIGFRGIFTNLSSFIRGVYMVHRSRSLDPNCAAHTKILHRHMLREHNSNSWIAGYLNFMKYATSVENSVSSVNLKLLAITTSNQTAPLFCP